jgi:hypothetical protein
MEKEFVPYQPSLELKELGFDEPCFWWYDFEKELRKDRIGVNSINSKYFLNGNSCSAPLYQQAFRWFREKYNIVHEINVYSTSDGYSYSYKLLLKKYTPFIDAHNSWIEYEEAELECLKKLIEIVKEKKKINICQ